MRSDMKEVIIERPRSGSKRSYKNIRRSDSELRNVRGMKKAYGYESKSQSDVLGPLERYLKSKVGEPWNDVWSDICKSNDNRSVVGGHLRDHVLNHLVNFNVVVAEDGTVWDGTYGRYPISSGFYVHPDSGLLCYIPRMKYRREPENKKIIRFNGMEFIKWDGIWYEIETAPVWSEKDSIRGEWYPLSFNFGPDAFGMYYSWPHRYELTQAYGEAVYVMKKQAIGKRMIKKLEKFINDRSN